MYLHFFICRCIELSPDNSLALMALAVSYTNEAMQNKALDVLKRWMSATPKYSSLIKPGVDGATGGGADLFSPVMSM